jgi:hypothetical protein
MHKDQMVAIVQENFSLWPKELKWDVNPLERNKKPTTKTLIQVIMEKYNEVSDGYPEETSLASRAELTLMSRSTT